METDAVRKWAHLPGRGRGEAGGSGGVGEPSRRWGGGRANARGICTPPPASPMPGVCAPPPHPRRAGWGLSLHLSGAGAPGGQGKPDLLTPLPVWTSGVQAQSLLLPNSGSPRDLSRSGSLARSLRPSRHQPLPSTFCNGRPFPSPRSQPPRGDTAGTGARARPSAPEPFPPARQLLRPGPGSPCRGSLAPCFPSGGSPG